MSFLVIHRLHRMGPHSIQSSQDVEAFSALLMATGRATKPEATKIVLEEAVHRFGNPWEINNFKFCFVIFLGRGGGLIMGIGLMGNDWKTQSMPLCELEKILHQNDLFYGMGQLQS